MGPVDVEDPANLTLAPFFALVRVLLTEHDWTVRHLKSPWRYGMVQQYAHLTSVCVVPL